MDNLEHWLHDFHSSLPNQILTAHQANWLTERRADWLNNSSTDLLAKNWLTE